MSGDRDFWSRRRAAVAAEEQAEAEARAREAVADEQAALEDKTDAEILAELELPDPDTLEKGDDFSVFMRSVVPDRIRRRALRRLWTSNPVLANLDGLNDYDEDFRAMAAASSGAVSTLYQVGRGFATRLGEIAGTLADEDTEQPAQSGPRQTAAKAEESAPDAVPAAGEAEEDARGAEEGASGTEGHVPPPRRRIKFDFSD